jgi:hypothetical protein
MYSFLLGPEYGTMEAAWKGILTESERVSEMHTKIKDQLCNEVMQEIRVWQKDNFHKVRFFKHMCVLISETNYYRANYISLFLTTV